MKVKEIEAKSILNKVKKPSEWFGIDYGMNIYKGCQHHCIYCDARSLCYQIEDFDHEIIVKKNAVELLENSFHRMRKRYTIGFGGMSDPYIPLEKKYELTRKSLEVLDRHRMRVNIITKSNMILRDVDILERIAKRYACVGITITTMDEELAKKIEPNVVSPKARMETVAILNELGITTGILMMPQLPYLMESREHIDAILRAAKEANTKFIYPSFGMTLRDVQRQFYYEKINEIEEGLSKKYEKRFKEYYMATCVNYKKMKQYFHNECKKMEIPVGMHSYNKEIMAFQQSLFDGEIRLDDL